MTEQVPSDARCWWAIYITGYGRFWHFGTKAEAEEMREHKADWEGGHGTKRKATPAEIEKAREEVKAMVARGYGWDRTDPRDIEIIRDAHGGVLPEGVALLVMEPDEE